jgi:hypothetical protein
MRRSCKLGIADRIGTRRRLRDARQRGDFGQRELVELLAEIGFGGCRDTIRPLAEVDHVQVQPEDLLFGEFAFEPVRQEDLLQLAAPFAVLAQEQVTRGLHRDRAGALQVAARQHVDESRAQDARIVEARVLEEAIVLRGQERLLDALGDVGERDRGAPLLADLRDQLAAARVDAQRHLELGALHACDRRQRWVQVDVSAGNGIRDRQHQPHQGAGRQYGKAHCGGLQGHFTESGGVACGPSGRCA